MPVPRFRLRTLMIAVAAMAVAILIGSEAVRLRRVSRAMSQKATEFRRLETLYRRFAANDEKKAAKYRADAALYHEHRIPEDVRRAERVLIVRLGESEGRRGVKNGIFELKAGVRESGAKRMLERASDNRQKAEYYAGLSRKYGWAARSPWIKVRPDPPEPGDGIEIELPLPSSETSSPFVGP